MINFTMNKNDLKTIVGDLSLTINKDKKVKLPILSNIRISNEANILVFETTDLNTYQRVEVKNDAVFGFMPITISCDVLKKLLSKMTDTTCNVSIEPNQALKINGYSINGIDGLDFPNMPTLQCDHMHPIQSFEASNNILLSSINSIARDASKIILCHLGIKSNGYSMKLASTDGYRMTVNTETSNTFDSNIEAILNSDFIKILSKITGKKDQVLHFELDRNNIKTSFIKDNASYTVVSKLIQGKYPNYEQILPTDFDRYSNVNKKRLMGLIDRAIVAAPVTNVITLTFDKSDLRIESRNDSMSFSNDILIDDSENCDQFSINFNYEYLKNILNNIDSDVISFSMNSVLNPAIIKGVNDYNNEKIAMLMPVKP